MRRRSTTVRSRAWAFGRALRDELMDRYREEYGLVDLPAPAFIVDELITDFLSARLRFDPLPVDRYAQTELVDGRLTITVNKLTADIPGVVDVEGVQNVAKFHESIHVVRDADLLRTRQQLGLNGMETAEHIVCFRQGFGRWFCQNSGHGQNSILQI